MMSLTPASHPWTIPVNIVPPANGDSVPITDWKNLCFGPIGLYHLRRWLGVYPNHPNLFTANQSRFRSADLAWFASGTHTDGNHHHQAGMFHPSFLSLHQATSRDQALKEERKEVLSELQDLLFDSAALCDRVSGGTTMVIRVGGTMMPGAPMRPEYLKANVYLPPSLIHHHPDLQQPIINIVQSFIETIGVRTVEDWTHAARKQLGYSLAHHGPPPFPNPLFNMFPRPQPGSARYIFLGKPASSSATSIVNTPSVSSSLTSPPPSPTSESSFLYSLDEEYGILREKCEALEQEVISLRHEKDRVSAELEALSRFFLDEMPHIPPPQGLTRRVPLSEAPPILTSIRTAASSTTPPHAGVSQNFITKSTSHPTKSSANLNLSPGSHTRRRPKSSATQVPSRPSLDTHYELPVASGSNSSNHDADAPHAHPITSSLYLLLRTLDLLHLKTQILLVRGYVPPEKQLSELIAVGLSKEIAQKVVSLF